MFKIIKTLKQYSFKEKSTIASYLVLRTVKVAISVLMPLISAKVITNLLEEEIKQTMQTVLVLCIFYAVGLFASHATKVSENKLIKLIHYNVQKDLTTKVFAIPPSQLSIAQGRLISLILHDSSAISTLLLTFISAIFSVVTVLGIGVVVFQMNWKLSLMLLCMYPVNIAINLFYGKRLKECAGSHFEKKDEYISSLKNAIGNKTDISICGGEQAICDKLDEHNMDVYQSSLLQGRVKANYATSMSGMSLINHLLLTVIGIVFVYSGYIEFGDFVAFNSYSKSLTSAIDLIINLNSIMQPGIVSVERLNQLEAQYDSSMKLEQAKQPLSSTVQLIEFDNVSFSNKEKSILRNVSIRFQAGEIIGIWGENASGKTTLANLLLSNLLPSHGRIYLNGFANDTLSYKSINHHISYVGTSSNLFDISVRDNLLISCDDIPDDVEIDNICKVLNLEQDIDCLPRKFDTILSENVKLSSGQIQKIKLARALLSKPDVLVLDEAFSNLDINVKSKTKSYLQRLRQEGKIILFISHDSDDYDICDRIYSIEGGTVNPLPCQSK